jgi:hypothetical protein
MRNMLTFTCPELDCTYEAVYRELALHLELGVQETIDSFQPDDAVARLKYHRRQARRREVFQELANELGIDATTVFAACNVDGAQLLLEAVRERRAALV